MHDACHCKRQSNFIINASIPTKIIAETFTVICVSNVVVGPYVALGNLRDQRPLGGRADDGAGRVVCGVRLGAQGRQVLRVGGRWQQGELLVTVPPVLSLYSSFRIYRTIYCICHQPT